MGLAVKARYLIVEHFLEKIVKRKLNREYFVGQWFPTCVTYNLEVCFIFVSAKKSCDDVTAAANGAKISF